VTNALSGRASGGRRADGDTCRMSGLLPAQEQGAIAVNGVLVPILVDEKNRFIDGHYRNAIADEFGYDFPRSSTRV
jgi:hypothetical protein